MENLNDIKKKGQIKGIVFWPSMIIVMAFVIASAISPDGVGNVVTDMWYSAANAWGWSFELITFLCFIFSIVMIIGKYGDIVIGGEGAKPKYKAWNWVTMSICSCVGTGLLFWAMGEPIYHYFSPALSSGIEGESPEAAIWSLAETMTEWSFYQYAMYAIAGVAFAVLLHNYKKPLSVKPVVEMVFKKHHKPITNIICIILVVIMVVTVGCSMGVGVLQIAAGIEHITGISQSVMVYLIISAAITVVYVLSCVSGIHNGLTKLSSWTFIAFLGIMLFVLVLGPTEYIAKIGTEAFGNMASNFPEKLFILNSQNPSDTWHADWMQQYLGSFIIFAPLLGMFLSRMAEGRTVKQFMLVNILCPSCFAVVWIAIFGGTAIHLQQSGQFDVFAAVNEYGIQSTIFNILGSFPLGVVLIIVFILAICTSFSTLADPVASSCSTLCSKFAVNIDDEPPRLLKISVGVIIGICAFLLVWSGSVNTVKGVWVILGLPALPILVVLIIAMFKASSRLLHKPGYLDDGNADLHK